MDYDVMRKCLNDVLHENQFIMRFYEVIKEADLDDKRQVIAFEDREVVISENIKLWKNLTIQEKKQLLATLSKLDQSDSEQALAMDLLLHTMRAPGYDVEDLSVKENKVVYENRPGRINLTAMGYASQRNSSSRSRAMYGMRFDNLKKSVDNEINATYVNPNGWTNLMAAVQKSSMGPKNVRESYLSLAQEMIQTGADVNAVTTKRYIFAENGTDFKLSESPDAVTLTPLIVAARLGNLDAVDVLMKNGAKLDQKDSSGKTALDWVNLRIAAEKDSAVKQRFEFVKARLNGDESVFIRHGGNSIGFGNVQVVAGNLEGIDPSLLQPEQTEIVQPSPEESNAEEPKAEEPKAEEPKAEETLTQSEVKKTTIEEFFAELRKAEINHETVSALLEKGAVDYINETDPIKEGLTSGSTPLAIAVIRGDVKLVQTVIAKGADVNKKSNDKSPLQLALQQLEEAKKTEDAAKIKAAEEIVKALKDAGAKEEEGKSETKVVEVDSLARAEGESLSDWYARVAGYWGEQEAKLRTQIEAETDAEKKKVLSTQAEHQKKLTEVYTKIYEKENELANETDPEKRRKLLMELTQLSGQLLKGVPAYYKMHHKDVLEDTKHPLSIQMNNQTSEILKASNAYQKEALALNQKREKTDDKGVQPGILSDPVHQGPEVNVGTPPTTPTTPTNPTGVTPALVDSVAQAKHDGSQEKSWWERNQEWIWWVLGIAVAAVLGYFGFRKGGWFNKDKKKTTTTTNSNTNTNTNTNEGTGNTNIDTNAGNTDANAGANNDTLSSSGRLYSSQEVNDAIAANMQNILNSRG